MHVRISFSPPLRLTLALALALIAAATARAQLAAQSPFVPPTAAAAIAPARETKLELRGILTVGGRTLFRVHDPARNTGAWLALGQRVDAFEVKRYDPVADTITVEYQNRSHTLALPAGKVAGDDRPAPGQPSDGTDIVPPGTIRDAIRNNSLSPDEIKPWAHTVWYQDFIKRHPRPGPASKP